MSDRLTLDCPDDEDDSRLDAAIHEYLSAAEAGPVDGAAWVARHPPELRGRLAEFVAAQEALNRLRPPPVRTTPLALQDFHRYTRLRLLGKGGMGAVYRAHDSVLDRAVAIKVLHPDLSVNKADVDRFLREARVMARLQHRNIIPVYDYGLMPGSQPRPYLSMQLVEGPGEDPRGTTLSNTIRGHHSAPTPAGFQALVTAFLGVCDAIAYAHDQEVLHRDLKPGNVLMLGERDVLVVDWGLGKVITPDSRRTTGLGGTPEYLAPEVASGAAEVGKPVDVFGLGGILAMILTGAGVYAPPPGGSAVELAARSDTSGCISRLRACGQAAELVSLTERCLAVTPTDRPTAREVVTAVAGYLSSTEERARAAEIEAVRASERQVIDRRRWRWVVWGAVGGMSVIVIAVTLIAWFTLSPSRS